MGVDESGRYHQAGGIDDATCLSVREVTYGADVLCHYPNVGAIPGRAGPIDDGPTGDD